MTRQEVIERLCALCSKVGDMEFPHDTAHDCFCGKNPLSRSEVHFQFDPRIIQTIERVMYGGFLPKKCDYSHPKEES